MEFATLAVGHYRFEVSDIAALLRATMSKCEACHLPAGEHYAVVPAVYLDLVKGEKVWVYGLNFAYKF